MAYSWGRWSQTPLNNSGRSHALTKVVWTSSVSQIGKSTSLGGEKRVSRKKMRGSTHFLDTMHALLESRSWKSHSQSSSSEWYFLLTTTCGSYHDSSIYFFLSPHIHPSSYPSMHLLTIYPHIYPPTYSYIYPPVHPSIHLFIHLPTYPSVHSPISPFAYLSSVISLSSI